MDDYRLVAYRKIAANGRFDSGISLYCMNPAIVFQALAGECRSVILTSGTLTPMDTFAAELGVDFPVVFSGGHVIDPHNQLFAVALEKGPRNFPMVFNYQNMKNVDLLVDVCQVILLSLTSFTHSSNPHNRRHYRRVCAATPGGVLVFFPSISVMSRIQSCLEDTGVSSQLAAIKAAFWEDQSAPQDKFDITIEEYRHACRVRGGGVLFAVVRGRISEGFDFPDELCRAVVAVGIPYAAFKAPEVTLKRSYNDARHAKNPNALSGQTWYDQSAFRALNQAVGRCIRHAGDHGAVVFCDNRIVSPQNQAKCSRWIRENLRVLPEFPQLERGLRAFFAAQSCATECVQDAVNEALGVNGLWC